MRIDRLRLKGLGTFSDEVSVDLTNVPGRLCAVVGGNGQGKSTLLELMLGALYRRTPTRGSLAELATARDAFVEIEVLNRQRWTIRQTVDAYSGKGEALVLDEAGSPVLPSGKVREADGWISSHFPAQDVVVASMFSVQGGEGGFLGLKPAERKSCLLRALGIERLEALAEQARERVRGTRGQADVLAARIADERERGGDIDEATNALEEARTKVERAGEDLAAARQELGKLEQEAEEAREEQRAEQEVQRRMAELRTRVSDAHSRGEDLELRIRNNRRVLEEADTIRAAVKRRDELVAEQAITRETTAAVATELDSLRRRVEDARRAGREAQAEAERASAEAQSAAEEISARRDRVAEAEAALEGRGEALRQAEVELAKAEEELERLRGLRVAGAEQRIVDLRKAHELVADGAEEPTKIARGALELDDERVLLAAELPDKMTDCTAVTGGLRQAAQRARNALAETERALAERETIEALRASKDAAELRYGQAQVKIQQATKGEAEAAAAAKAAQDKLDELHTRTQGEKAELDDLARLCKRAQALDSAEARLAELEPQLEETQAQGTAAQRELRELEESQPPGYEPASVPEVAPLRRRVEELERSRASTEAAVSVIEARLASAKAAAKRLAELEAERAQLDIELADWTRLAEDLGRDGLQALEIDAAGPELTELINDLLRSCVGSRWTVTVETTRTSADGKRQLEGCEVRVLDAERGRDGTAESLSGGERVLVGEAVSLALSMLACRRAGVQGPTLVRDESGAALDPEKGPAYIAMLRRAADIVGASHVLFVSHSPELHELADARIVVRDGRLEVQA